MKISNEIQLPGRRHTMPDSDADLLQSMKQKHTQRDFAQLCERYSKPAFNLAFYLIRDAHLAEEAVQETMLSLWNAAPNLDTGDLRGWIMRTVANKSMNLARGRSRLKSAMKSFKQKRPADSIESQEEHTERSELVGELNRYLNELPLLDRQLVALHFVSNLSQQQIADRLKVPQTTISGRLRRILQGLRNKLTSAGLAVSLIDLDASVMDDAITQYGSPPSEFHKRLTEIPNNLKANAAPSKRPAAAGWAVLALLLVLSGLAWKATDTALPSKRETSKPLPKKSTQPQTKSPLASEVPASPGDALEVIYRDEFDGPKLSSFWAAALPSKHLKFGTEKDRSRLLFSLANNDTSPNAPVLEAELKSNPIDLGNKGSVFIRFEMLLPRLSGTIEYKYEIMTNQSETVYVFNHHIQRLPGRKGYQVTILPSPKDPKGASYRVKQLDFDVSWEVALETPETGRPGTVISNERTSNFKRKPDGGWNTQTQDHKTMFRSIRIRLSVKVHPGSWIEWPLERALIYRANRKLPPGTNFPIAPEPISKLASP